MNVTTLRSHLLRTTILLLLMLMGGMNGAWATDYRYLIINNSGNVAIQKTETDPIALTVPTEIVPPFNIAQWYFYNTLAEAQADANAVRNSSNPSAEPAASGNVTDLNDITNSDHYIYVRYRHTPSASDPIDLSGNTWYKIKNNDNNYGYARENGNKLDYSSMYYTSSGNNDTYLWKFTGEDPYAINIETKGTVYGNSGVKLYTSNNTNINLTTGTTNTNFILLNHNSPGYYVWAWVINTTGTWSDLKFFWNDNGVTKLNQDNTYRPANNYRRYTFEPLINITYSLTTHVGSQMLTSDVAIENLSTAIAVPTTLQRKFISSYNCYYLDASSVRHDLTLGSSTYNDLPSGITTIYVDYIVDTNALPFAVSTSIADAHWYNVKINGRWTYNQVIENASWKNLKLKADDNVTETDKVSDIYKFAFFGDPYELKVVNKYSSDYFLGVPAGTSSMSDITFSDAINATGINTWEMIDGTNYAADAFILRQFGTAASPWYFRSDWSPAKPKYMNTLHNDECRWLVSEPPTAVNVTYEVYNSDGELMTTAATTTVAGLVPSLPEKAVRMACEYTYHSGSTTGPVLSTITDKTETIYVTYTVNTANLPFTFSTDYSNATWYNMQIPHYGNNTWIYDNGTNGITKTSPSDLTAKNTYYAFTGDPYRMRILNMERGGDYEAQHSGHDSYSQLVRFQPMSPEEQWGLVVPVTSGTGRFQILFLPTEDNVMPSYLSGSTGLLNLTNSRSGGFEQFSAKSSNDDIRVQTVTKTYYPLTYKVYNAESKELAATYTTYYSAGDAISVAIPDAVKQNFSNYSDLYDTFNGNMFSNSGVALPTTMPSSSLTYYITYSFTYNVVNLSGKVALTYKPASSEESYSIVSLPDQFKSPLAKNYAYYTRSQLNYNSSTDTYTLKTGQTPLIAENAVPAGTNDIYVMYEYDAAGATAMDFDLSGTKSYTLHNKKTGHVFEMCVDNAGNLRSRNVITQKRMWYEWWPNGTKINNDTFDPYEVTLEVHCVDDQTVLTQLGAYTQATDKTAENANLKKYQSNRTCITWMILNKDASGSVALMVNRYPSVSNGSSASKFQYLCENESNSSNALQTKWYTGSEEDARFVFQPIYTYHVVNLSNTEAISAIEGHLLTDENHTPTVPQRILSPMVKKYQFYDKSCVTINGTSITLKANAEELSDVRLATDHDIYVFYRPADIDNSIFDLTGQVSYNMYTENQTLYAYDGSSDDVKSKASPTADEKESNSYLWILKGNDPYNVQIYNTNGTRNGQPIGHYQVSASVLGQPKSNWSNLPYFDLSKGQGSSSLGSINSYCMVWGTSATRGSSQIQLLAKSLSDINDWYLSNIQSNGFKFCWYFNTLGGSTGKNENSSVVNFIPAHNDELTYVIVNKKGNEALSVKSNVAMGVAPNLPLALKSPFATNYTYHSTKSNSSDNIVTTTTENQTIYVYYDRDETNTDLGLNAEGYYYMKVNGCYAYTDSEDNTGKTNNEKGTGDAIPYYVWTLDADDDPYDILMRLPVLDDKVLGLEGYTHPSDARRRVPAEHTYPLKAVDATSDATMRFALLNGNNLDGHYALAVTLGSAGSNGGTLPESALYGDMLDYVGSQSAGTLQLLQQSIDNVDDAAQVEFEPYTLYYTYHIVDPQADGNGEHPIIESYTLTDEIPVGTSATDAFPDALVRLGCPLSSNGYYTAAGTWPGEHGMRLGFQTDIYVSYKVDESLLPFRYSNSANSIDQMYWHNWYGNGGTNAKIISSGDVVAGSLVDDPSESACFAFFGDPYRTQIINRQQGKTLLVTIGSKDTWSLISFSRDGDAVTPTTATTTDGWAWFRVFGTSNEAQPNYISAANPVALSNDNTSANWEETLRHKFKAWGAKYSIVDLSNTIAATTTSRSAYIEVPNEILSPALDGSKVKYSFTNDRTTAKSLIDITREPYSFETVYVFYTKDDIKDIGLKLNNTKMYNFLVADNSYVYVSGSSIVATSQSGTQNTDAYLWTLNALSGTNMDPYQLSIVNANGTTSVSKYILLSGNDNSHYTLLQSSPTADGTTANPRFYYTTALTAQNATPAQVQFNGIPVTVTYKVVNLENRVAIMYTVKKDDATTGKAEGGDAPVIPDKIKSSLVEESGGEFSYHTATDDGNTNEWRRVYTKGGVITALDYRDNQIVYVYYTYNSANSTIDLNGGVKYNVSYDNKNYIYYGNSSKSWYSTNNDVKRTDSKPGDTTLRDKEYQWRIKGDDPYNVQLQNMGLTWGQDANDYGRWRNTAYGDANGNTSEWYLEPTNTISDNMNSSQGARLGTAYDCHFVLLPSTSGNGESKVNFIVSYASRVRDTAASTMGSENYYTNTNNTNKYIYLNLSGSYLFRGNAEALTTLTPNLTLPVTYHLTHTVTGKNDETSADVTVLSRLNVPDGWERKYCTYTYTYYYQEDTDDNNNPVNLPKTKDDYTADPTNVRKVENATVLPSLYIAEGDEETRVHIYVNYEANMPFNVLATTQAQIEMLATGTKALETFFDLTSYEKRTQTLGSIIAENPAAFTEYLASYPDVQDVTARASLRRCDFVYFMVMDTNDDYSRGNQYFLHRNTDGRVDWLNNDFKLYVQRNKNYRQWDYSRCAEYYRENDHDPFQEKRWLWAFAGDPYDFFVFNLSGAMKETWNELHDGVDAEYYLDHVVNYRTLTNKQGDITGYAPKIPDYDETLRPQDHYAWALADGKGTSSDDSFSLMAGYLNVNGDFTPSLTGQPLYWRMNDGKTVSLQERSDAFTGLNYNIKLLPYEPKKYEDVRLMIRRNDEVDIYTSTYPTPLEEQSNPTTKAAQQNHLNDMTTGISRMYFSTEDRMFVAGDVIDAQDQSSIPFEVRRAFCNYTSYNDDFRNTNTNYTVIVGPKRGAQKTKNGQPIYDESGRPVYTYLDEFDNLVEPQTVYASYEVTSDIFLKQRPTKAQVAEMKSNNDHVYFMDFPNPKMLGNQLEGYNTGHHAYFDERATFQPQVGTLHGVTEKMKWDASTNQFVGDEEKVYNNCQYRTTTNRMTSVPEDLKWYFVGDPYRVQIYNTNSEFENDNPNCTNAANLARFDPTESQFQFVVDCVHLRVPDKNITDNRKKVTFTDENGEELGTIDNNHYGKPYYDDFYWEVVPSATDVEDGFALRFRADNQILGYRNVYYYLTHDGLKREYRQANENRRGTYDINLNYRTHNERHLSGKYISYHEANNDSTVIRLIQPSKVYFSAYKDNYSGNPVVKEELSEYFGVGETIYEVPRHLQRKFVEYGNLEYQKNNNSTWNSGSFPFVLDKSKDVAAYNMEDCTEHNSVVFVDGTQHRASYKFRVTYTVSDLTNTEDGKQVHLFTTDDSNPQWIDMMVGNGNWLYYDKTNVDGDGTENQTTLVSNYRRAMSNGKTGWNNEANGWNDGLKGLHWAFIGDPYDFTILNRRRSEDGTVSTDPMWLAVTKATILDYNNNNTEPADSVIWTTSLIDQSTYDAATEKTSTGTDALAEGGINTHFSLQMTKTGSNFSQMGNSDSNYFLRTASLKQASPDNGAGGLIGDYSNDQTDPGINQTNKYWRLVSKAYPNGTSNYTSYFEMVPYSLNDFDTYSNNVNAVNYSQTMADMGVKQQLLTIRTAVAKDNDGADNDCFDADVQIVTDQSPFVLRIKRENLELRYGNATESLPISLKRYGCTYKCYLDYVDNDNRGIEITDFDSNEKIKNGKTFRELEKESSTNLLLTYVYTVQDNVSPFFTTELDAETEDYTWLNTYYQWTQYYKGTNVEVEYYEPVFDHYVYNADGHIIDEVYRYEKKTKIVSNDPTPYYPTAYVNTHTDQKPTYADEGAQSENDRQKWSLIGDPYSFNMKNYAQFLKNRGATVIVEGKNVTTSIIEEEAQNFTLAIDKNGNTYLSLIDENGEVIKCVSFTYSNSSDKSLTTMGNGAADYDPTGNTLDTGGAKPFFLANLIKYADILQYHLVIAHQHSLDAEEDYLQELSGDFPSGITPTDLVVDGYTQITKAEARKTVKDHLLEYLMYMGIYQQRNKDYYISSYATDYDGILTPTAWNMGKINDIKALLKSTSLRDIVSYPVADYSVNRVGIGNRPAVPWYMRRQFCTYRMYQRDVQRSVTTDQLAYLKNEAGQYVDYDGNVVDEDHRIQLFMPDGSPAYEIEWVSIFDKSRWANWDTTAKETDVKETVGGVDKKQPSGYAQALALQGKVLEKLEDCHYNRKVIIDVVYEVNPEQFRFASRGRNTTAWYQMMTNNALDGLMNFTYKDGIGTRLDRTEHYTNNYLWAPEGDPYGFVLRSRYATINGTGWNDVAVTTKGQLPKAMDKTSGALLDINNNTFEEDADITGQVPMYQATYTSRANTAVGTSFKSHKVVHNLKVRDGVASDGATNAIYEMFMGNYPSSFLMHPTSAWTDNSNTEFASYYMVHNTTDNTTLLTHQSARTLRDNPDANWRLQTTAEQLWPYFERAGYVGGLDPTKANNFTNKELYNRLKEYVEDPTLTREYRVLNNASELVYSGTFKNNEGTVVEEGETRPAQNLLPMTFESTNLVNMKPGYYRIRAFSQKALDIDGNDLKGDGDATTTDVGIVGPRYISGYRFKSEKTDPGDPNNNGGRWLHFFETDQEHSRIHTFGQLKNVISAAGGGVNNDRDQFDHVAMRGNIEILPAEYDPSSIFQFVDATSNNEKRYSIHTQGMKLWARSGGTEGIDASFGKTELSDDADFSSTNTGFDDRFRLDDVGGTAFTLRTITNRSGDWDNDVAENIKTNYICIDRNHRYRITSHTNNEMVEIGDHIEQGDALGRSYAIQDTKWLLQPVGTKTAWPYNQMPLRVEVQKGGKNASNAEDKNYYGSLYVPFDTRLGSTVDVAFTMTNLPKGDASSGMSVTMQAVSQLNNMGNPQYIPATWPVVIRTSNQKEAMLKNQDGSTYATKHYVDLYLPYDAAQNVDKSKILLNGEYLEQTLLEPSDLVQQPDNSTSRNRVMVFGLPFANPHGEHNYDTNKRVGWYTNENWARENDNAYEADARSATDAQRDNRYVYHNKAYYIYNYTAPGGGAKPHIVAIFDEEDYDFEEDKDIEDTITERTPWPCDVYDLSGRKVATHETPQTLRQNNPGLPKGVYIFGHKKVVVK